jgi:cytochrome c peroxidase
LNTSVRSRVKLFTGLVIAAFALGIPAFLLAPLPETGRVVTRVPAEARMAQKGKLDSLYRTWRAGYERSGGNRNYVIALGWSRGLSTEHTDARGIARIDMTRGAARVEIEDLDTAKGWDVWLIDNQEGPQRSALPESGDRMHKLGRLYRSGAKAVLDARFDGNLFSAFQVDVVAVTRKGVRPDEGAVLYGSPILFQRLYTRASHPQERPSPMARLAFFGPRAAFADTPFNSTDPLIAAGADLFFNETFGGNSRTCGTCHPAENNFTIDPEFIGGLPSNDPLFVAETNPALAVNFEKPQLLRELGLVLENVDGFEDLDNKFVLRGVPHLLGLSRYLVPGVDGSTVPPNQRTGWGGDGAPGSGTLREFATGAVVQHFTKSLNRVPGTDFRLPTDAELDALEAFQLALGRQDNPDITAIQLRNPMANLGRVQHNGVSSRCSVCHFNAGGNAANGTNRNFDIGAGRLPNHPANVIAPGNLPPDGGFGTAPVFDPVTNEFKGYGNPNGDIRFNTQPAIEAVDTAPFFHNNSVFTIEEAVGFYNSQAFKKSQAGIALPSLAMETTEVENIAAFLRIMNALENIRSSLLLNQSAIEETDRDTAQRLAHLASFDTEDAVQVLTARQLHPTASRKLREAHAKELAAAFSAAAHSKHQRDGLLQDAMLLKQQARAEMIVE